MPLNFFQKLFMSSGAINKFEVAEEIAKINSTLAQTIREWNVLSWYSYKAACAHKKSQIFTNEMYIKLGTPQKVSDPNELLRQYNLPVPTDAELKIILKD